MNEHLVSLLRANIGQPITPDLAADILVLADQIPSLVPFDVIERIEPEVHGEFTFAVERIEDIVDEIRPLHRAHWDEVEASRRSLTLQPDYSLFIKYERAGRFVLFTLRKDGRLLGHCSIYLSESAHTQTIIATEDAIYLLPEARKGRTAARFVAFVEKSLKQIGAKEIEVSVKTTNKAARFFQMLGYRQVDVGLKKVLD